MIADSCWGICDVTAERISFGGDAQTQKRTSLITMNSGCSFYIAPSGAYLHFYAIMNLLTFDVFYNRSAVHIHIELGSVLDRIRHLFGALLA